MNTSAYHHTFIRCSSRDVPGQVNRLLLVLSDKGSKTNRQIYEKGYSRAVHPVLDDICVNTRAHGAHAYNGGGGGEVGATHNEHTNTTRNNTWRGRQTKEGTKRKEKNLTSFLLPYTQSAPPCSYKRTMYHRVPRALTLQRLEEVGTFCIRSSI
jgi:hypothetical protein